MAHDGIPNRVYKYRGVNNQTIHAVMADLLFFSDPEKFNDPMDSRPSVDPDLDNPELEKLLKNLLEQRFLKEADVAARSLNIRADLGSLPYDLASRAGEKAEKYIEILRDIADWSNDEEGRLRAILSNHIEEELLRRHDHGIVSFSENPECPLMWSHYGDQHEGISIGYSAPGNVENLYPVEYGGERTIKSSRIASMLDGDEDSRRQVWEASLLRKAQSWSYEKEWRLIGAKGLEQSVLKMEEIVFGMNCPHSIQCVLIKALGDRSPPLEFSRIKEIPGAFHLKSYVIPPADEMFARFPSTSTKSAGVFKNRS